LKDRITEENKIRDILEGLNMHSIKDKGDYYSCGMPDGDNKSSTIVYKDSLYVEAHTRGIKDEFGGSDIISLVMFIRKEYISVAIKWMCETCGFDYYGRDYEKPSFLSVLDELFSMNTNSSSDDEDMPLKPISENILSYYPKVKSKMFLNDGILYSIQNEFEIGYDHLENRITIPIRDEHNILVGVKGRLNYNPLSFENKYIYIEKCSKKSILYGLNKAYESIKSEGIVYVAESEKSVLQAFSKGIRNVVAIGGKKLSTIQVKKLTHLGVEICLCYDDKANFGKDGEIDKEFYKKQKDMFIDSVKLTAIIDKNNDILGEKESPFDNMDMWDELLQMKKLIL
jgi:DNA primase